MAGPLRCHSVAREPDHNRALTFYFDRYVTDEQIAFLFACMQRSAAMCEAPAKAPVKPPLSIVPKDPET